MVNILLVVIFTLLIIPGLVGIILPILPGLPYMFVVALVYGLVTGFVSLTLTELGILGLIMVGSIMISYLSGFLGAAIGGASKNALIGGTIGLLIGLLAFPPWGIFIGLYLGVLVAQYMESDNHRRALKAANSSLIGSLSGIMINLVLAIVFIFLFVIFAVTS